MKSASFIFKSIQGHPPKLFHYGKNGIAMTFDTKQKKWVRSRLLNSELKYILQFSSAIKKIN